MDFPLITVKPYTNPKLVSQQRDSLFIAATQSHRLNPEYLPSVKNLFPKYLYLILPRILSFIHLLIPPFLYLSIKLSYAY